MMDNDGVEVLIGEEVIRVLLETFDLGIVFSNWHLELFTTFTLHRTAGGSVVYDPSVKSGDLNILWDLVGRSVQESRFENGLFLTFDNAARLELMQRPDRDAGRLQSRDWKRGEDF